MNRRLVIALALSCVLIATGASAQWVACVGGSTTCTTAKVGVGFTNPTYPVSVSTAAAIAGGGISTGGEGNFNVTFASGNAFLGQAATTGSVVFGQGQGGGNILFTVWNGATNQEMVRITSTGRVGIGTATPSAALDINGGINVSGNIAAKYQDIAEWVPSDSDLASGSVVVLSDDQPNHVEQSLKAYDTKVAGVISERPGMILGEESAEKSKVATTGRVKVKVDATKHPIRIGDLLVTSDTPGYAMYSKPVDVGGVAIHRPGTIIGKALEPMAKGRGEILVLLSLQ